MAAALSPRARTAADRAGLDLGLDVTGRPETIRTPVDLLVFYTARELLANVVRHAGARHLHVQLALRTGRAELVVADDGIGADVATMTARLAEGHIGLNSHRVRVDSTGGTFALRKPPSSGSVVAVSVPVPGVAAARTSGRQPAGIAPGV